jgi:hypothetical protein
MIDAFRSNFGTSGTTALAAGDTDVLYANDAKEENLRSGDSNASTAAVTLYDNGFQMTADNAETNGSSSGAEYIWMAFA